MKARILGELANYKNRMLPFMPGRRPADQERAFFAIFSNDDRGGGNCTPGAGACNCAKVLAQNNYRAHHEIRFILLPYRKLKTLAQGGATN